VEYKVDKKKAIARVTVHSIDKYNFNKGMIDIFSGLPDDQNGRFVELGWAKSFFTKGSFDLKVEWSFK
jgi:hypothetical protein